MGIIQCRNLVKTYISGTIKVEALKGISLDIDPGEMVAVMGPSGCGKTTLLNCLSGIDDITSGNVLVEEREITTLGDDEKTDFRASRMGFVFQFFNLLPVLSTLENVELSLLLGGKTPKEARARATEVLTMVGLGDRIAHRPAALSGGERQRVAIARALVNHPAIVWADEPTGNLDRRTSEEIMDLMGKLNKENSQTFVIVTHDLKVGKKCNRILHMRDGLLVSQNGDIGELEGELKDEH